jgi:hypothetical protein
MRELIMKSEDADSLDVPPFQELATMPERSTGTIDDDDEPEDETEEENEAPIRETREETEAPEEFEVDDEDSLGHPEDDDADDDEDEEDDEDDV